MTLNLKLQQQPPYSEEKNNVTYGPENCLWDWLSLGAWERRPCSSAKEFTSATRDQMQQGFLHKRAWVELVRLGCLYTYMVKIYPSWHIALNANFVIYCAIVGTRLHLFRKFPMAWNEFHHRPRVIVKLLRHPQQDQVTPTEASWASKSASSLSKSCRLGQYIHYKIYILIWMGTICKTWNNMNVFWENMF